MRIVSTDSTSTRKLASAILLYEGAKHSVRGETTRTAFATIHPISITPEGAPVIGPGSLLKREALESAVTALADGAGTKRFRFIEDKVIASGPGMVAWFTPSRTQHMVFAGAGLQCAGVASQPAMLWVATNKDLFVFGLAEDARPGKASPVYHPPFYNVWLGGRLCQGTAQRPATLDPADWERMFYESAFTHPNDGGKWQTSHRGGIAALWKKLTKEQGKKRFPTEALVPTGATVEQIVEAIMTTGSGKPA